MITLNQEQRLGHKAFYLFLSRRSTLGFTFLLVTAGLFIVRGVLFAIPSQINTYISYGLVGLLSVSILLILFSVLVSWLEYHNYSFVFQEFDLIVKKGIFNREEISLPYRQMQDINIIRNLGHRLLGVSRLVIDSAGDEGSGQDGQSDAVLDPLEKEVAEEIRTFLDRQIGIQVVKDIKEADREASQKMAGA